MIVAAILIEALIGLDELKEFDMDEDSSENVENVRDFVDEFFRDFVKDTGAIHVQLSYRANQNRNRWSIVALSEDLFQTNRSGNTAQEAYDKCVEAVREKENG